MNWQPKPPALRALLKALLQQTPKVYVVGGAVRDFLLDQQNDKTDLDLVVAEAALPLARRVADRLGWSFYPLDEARDVARLVFTGLNSEPITCDIASVRGGSLETDLLARDFTVNALALALDRSGQTQLIDFCRGQEDLARRQLRRVTAASLADDPVRLLRVVRFAHQLRFAVEAETLTQVQRMSTTVRLASPERIRDELWKILITDTPAQALADLQSYNLLAHVLPEVALLAQIAQSPPHDQNVYDHTLRTVQEVGEVRHWLKRSTQLAATVAEPDWVAILLPWRGQLRRHFAQPLAAERNRLDWLVWQALLHDIGKAATHSREIAADGTVRHRFFEHERVGAELAAERLRHLRFSRQEISLTQAVVEGHMRPHQLHAAFSGQAISRRASYRYFRDVGGKQFSQLAGLDTLLVALADYRATATPMLADWPAYLSHLGELFTFALADQTLEIARHKPLLDGHQLMAHLHLPPGRQIGAILERVLEAQVAGEIQTIAEALHLAEQCLHETSEDVLLRS